MIVEVFEPVLYAAGDNEPALQALSRSAAPNVFIDLEFSVPEERKQIGLETTVAALAACNWQGKAVSVRVNGLADLTTFEEIGRLMAANTGSLRSILFPMAESAFDIAAIDRYMEVCELRNHARKSLKLEILIETPQALLEIEAIARASERTDALHFGPGDFAKGMGISLRAAGTPHPEYGFGAGGAHQHFQQADIWHYPLMRVAVTARALGLRAFDGPYVGGDDLAGYAAQCRRARALGLGGKWAVTEAQVNTLVNLDRPDARV